MNIKKLLTTRKAFSGVHDLSYFPDDPTFLVEVDGVRERIRAPSQVVLEHALFRNGLDTFTVQRVSSSSG